MRSLKFSKSSKRTPGSLGIFPEDDMLMVMLCGRGEKPKDHSCQTCRYVASFSREAKSDVAGDGESWIVSLIVWKNK